MATAFFSYYAGTINVLCNTCIIGLKIMHDAYSTSVTVGEGFLLGECVV